MTVQWPYSYETLFSTDIHFTIPYNAIEWTPTQVILYAKMQNWSQQKFHEFTNPRILFFKILLRKEFSEILFVYYELEHIFCKFFNELFKGWKEENKNITQTIL